MRNIYEVDLIVVGDNLEKKQFIEQFSQDFGGVAESRHSGQNMKVYDANFDIGKDHIKLSISNLINADAFRTHGRSLYQDKHGLIIVSDSSKIDENFITNQIKEAQYISSNTNTPKINIFVVFTNDDKTKKSYDDEKYPNIEIYPISKNGMNQNCGIAIRNMAITCINNSPDMSEKIYPQEEFKKTPPSFALYNTVLNGNFDPKTKTVIGPHLPKEVQNIIFYFMIESIKKIGDISSFFDVPMAEHIKQDRIRLLKEKPKEASWMQRHNLFKIKKPQEQTPNTSVKHEEEDKNSWKDWFKDKKEKNEKPKEKKPKEEKLATKYLKKEKDKNERQ
jgi:hypothetical protein